MQIKSFSEVKKLQEGGVAPQAQAAPAAAEEQAMQQLSQMALSIIEQLGIEAAVALAQIILDMAQSQAPVGEAPSEQQFMRCGGKLKKVKKASCGVKVRK